MLMTVFLCFQTVYANIDQLSNMSTEWIRTGNRNAATDSTDIVLYNPAGLTKMSQGYHLNFGNQTLFRSPEHKYNLNLPASNTIQSDSQDSPDWLLPNLYFSFKGFVKVVSYIPVCVQRRDVLILVDVSRVSGDTFARYIAKSQRNFDGLNGFITQIVQSFDLSTGLVRFGIITFDNSGAKYLLPLNNGNNFQIIKQSISTLYEGSDITANVKYAFDLIQQQQVCNRSEMKAQCQMAIIETKVN